MLALALFIQGLMSAHACVSADASAAKAVMLQQALADETGADEMPCHQAGKPNTNECLTHCTQSDQTSPDHAQQSVLPANAAVLQVALPDMHDSNKRFSKALFVATDSGPPLSILYCTFRI